MDIIDTEIVDDGLVISFNTNVIDASVSNEKGFYEHIEKEFKSNDLKTITLDLTGVEAVDSHGVGIIIKLYKLSGQKYNRFTLKNIENDYVKEILRLTKVERIMKIED